MAAGRRVFVLAFLLATISVSLFADSTVRCESKGGRRICHADDIGRVVIRRQLSLAACTEGDTWGYTRDAIWVDSGCRADFTVITRRRDRDDDRADRDDRYGRDRDDRDFDHDRGSRLVCESDGDRNFCPADTRFGVQLTRTLGRRSCIEGRNWGSTDRGIWVDDGCRAEFLLGGDRRDQRDEQQVATLTCESGFRHRRTCAADTRFGVELKRQISRTDCVFNRTWGYDRNGVWVANGCRAEFLIRLR